MVLHDLDPKLTAQLVAQPVRRGEVADALRLDPLRQDELHLVRARARVRVRAGVMVMVTVRERVRM